MNGSELMLCGCVPGPMVLVLGLNGVIRLPGVHDVDVGGELKGP